MTKSAFIFTLFFTLIISLTASAQSSPAAVKVTYRHMSNGKLLENQDPVIVISSLLRTDIIPQSLLEKKAKFPMEQFYVDRQTGSYVQIAHLSASKMTYTVDSLQIEKQIFELTNETKKILGYTCKKAKTEINSNKYDIWYTNDLKLKGAPTALGQNLGLVLEVERNGNYAITATKVQPLKKIPAEIISIPRRQKAVDLLTYRHKLWRSRFTEIPVFRNEVINFTDKPKSNDSIERFASGTVIARKVKFPSIKPGSRVFVDAVQYSAGDAYDRTASIFLIPRDKKISYIDGLFTSHTKLPVYENGNGKQYHGVVRTGDYSPPIELMRFFTPFGIQHYNTIKLKNHVWEDSVSYRQEISDLIPLLSNKEVWIGANISNYDAGGHRISVNITIHPDERPTENFALPLFMSYNLMEAAGQEYATMFDVDVGLEVEFDLPHSVKNAQLRYITTGHGGWDGGDEFNPKENTICLDDEKVHSFIPWRSDCGSYRNYNPASGNFSNGLSSSDYSRSNWCPATVTPPTYIPLGDLPAGRHKIQIKIPQGPREGNSFSSWAVSGVLIGNSK